MAIERTHEQRLAALKHANAIRVYRADVKRQIRSRSVDVHVLLADPPADLLTMKVFDLLCAMPKLGPTKVNRILFGCRISYAKTVGGLSSRQRAELVGMLAGRPAAEAA